MISEQTLKISNELGDQIDSFHVPNAVVISSLLIQLRKRLESYKTTTTAEMFYRLGDEYAVKGLKIEND